MNKAEAAYAAHLEEEKSAGRVLWWGYETFKFRLADSSYFTPDFAVLHADLSIEVVEYKGFLREAARVRFKAAAEMFSFFRWRMVTRKAGEWKTLYAY